jgi:beta-glucosidase
VKFTLTPEHLQLYDRNGHWTVEPGRFTVMIGAASNAIKLEGSFLIGDGTTPQATRAPEVDHTDPL